MNIGGGGRQMALAETETRLRAAVKRPGSSRQIKTWKPIIGGLFAQPFLPIKIDWVFA